MKLTGIEIKNYRSIGEEPVVLSPLKQCNILIGQNNSGKSNCIKAIQTIVTALATQYNQPIGEQSKRDYNYLDINKRNTIGNFVFKLHFSASETNQIDSKLVTHSRTSNFFFTYELNPGNNTPVMKDCNFANIKEFSVQNQFWQNLTGGSWHPSYTQEDWRENIIKQSLTLFRDFFLDSIPKVYAIEEFREIRPGGSYSLNGSNLIQLLANYQHPEIEQSADRQKFDKIQQFIRQLLHMPEAVLEVPDSKEMILLTNDGLRLPLQNYGTGVHQLVILLTAILHDEKSIYCIEEPEIHLHPTLQKEFIQFITTETDNQYIISTHSPAFINLHNLPNSPLKDKIQVFYLRSNEGVTSGGPVLEEKHSLDALADLGVKASDLLQTNCVIWVEGPSDRVYLNHWIKLIEQELVEGLHYSILFYGGRLLSHLTTQRDDTPEELIDLLKVNQHSIVMIDSDRKSKNSRINDTKRRIRTECETSESICWITDGREVENYLPSKVVTKACQDLFEVTIDIKLEEEVFIKFEEVLEESLKNAKSKKKCDYASNKVKYSKEFVKYFGRNDMTPELTKRVTEIVNQINLWNR